LPIKKDDPLLGKKALFNITWKYDEEDLSDWEYIAYEKHRYDKRGPGGNLNYTNTILY